LIPVHQSPDQHLLRRRMRHARLHPIGIQRQPSVR
jgi:hypothetical protein